MTTTHAQVGKTITVRGDAYQVTSAEAFTDGSGVTSTDGKHTFRLVNVATGDKYRATGKKIMHNSKVELVARTYVEDQVARQGEQPEPIDVGEYLKPMARAELARRMYADQGDTVSLAAVEKLFTQITKGLLMPEDIMTILDEIAEEATPSIPDDADATPAPTSTNTRKATTKTAATVAAQPKERTMSTNATTTETATSAKAKRAAKATGPKIDKDMEALAQRAMDATKVNDHAAARKILADGYAASPNYLVKGKHAWTWMVSLVDAHEAKMREEAPAKAAPVAKAAPAAKAAPVAKAAPAKAETVAAATPAPLADKAPAKGQAARDALDIIRAAHWSSAGVLICGAMRGDEYRAVANLVKPLGSAWFKEGKGFKFDDGINGPAVVTALLSGDTLPVLDTPAPANAAPVAKAPAKATKPRAAVVSDAAPIAPAWPAASLPAIVDANGLDDASKAALAAAYQAALAALTSGSATPAKAAKVATKAPAKAAATKSTATPFTLAKWSEGLGYRAQIKALRAALSAAGVTFELAKLDDVNFTITTDANAEQVHAIVSATVKLAELVNA